MPPVLRLYTLFWGAPVFVKQIDQVKTSLINMRVFVVIAATAFLVFAHLSPAKWKLRTGLGGSIDHFLAYFVVTLIVYVMRVLFF